MRIDEFEFRNKQGEEIEPTKNQLVIYIKSLHKQVADLETKLADMEQEQIKEMQYSLEMATAHTPTQWLRHIFYLASMMQKPKHK